MTLRVAALVTVLMGWTCFGQERKKDAIDTALAACLDSPGGVSTVGQQDCAAKAYAAWDAELNRVYQGLMKSLDPPSAALLRDSQRCWLAFFEAEKKFQRGGWVRSQGTLGGVTAGLANVDLVRSRVMTLRAYRGGSL